MSHLVELQELKGKAYCSSKHGKQTKIAVAAFHAFRWVWQQSQALRIFTLMQLLILSNLLCSILKSTKLFQLSTLFQQVLLEEDIEGLQKKEAWETVGNSQV